MIPLITGFPVEVRSFLINAHDVTAPAHLIVMCEEVRFDLRAVFAWFYVFYGIRCLDSFGDIFSWIASLFT